MSEPVGTDQAMWSGRIAIYRMPDGGAVIAHQQDGSEDVGNHHLAPFMVKMLEKIGERIGVMLGGGNDGT